ncbi:MAG: hypothetical protein ACFCVK_14455, partial [Acidimicrobiales bacterium]
PPPPPPPPGASGPLVYEGQFAALNDLERCFEVETPGTAGSTTTDVDCDDAAAQTVGAFGTVTEVTLIFTAPPNDTLCISSEIDGSNLVKVKPCDGADDQIWDVTDTGAGTYRFASRNVAGQCLRSTNSGLTLDSCTDNNSLRFTFS